MNERIPDVSVEDVLRIVQRDYAHRDQAQVLALLEQYGAERHEHEVARVRLAALKLAKGDLSRLKSEIHSAKTDYRDLLAFAEYPNTMLSLEPISNLDSDKASAIRASDWEQYQAWLTRS